LRDAIKSACEGGKCGAAWLGNGCWQANGTLLSQFPTLHVRIGPTTVEWNPRGYLSEQRFQRWCYTFFGDPPLTLGASFMLNHLVVFDREDHRIGFAPSSCPSFWSRTDPVPHTDGFGNTTTTPVGNPRTTTLINMTMTTGVSTTYRSSSIWLTVVFVHPLLFVHVV